MRSAYGQINRLVFKYRCQLILLLGPRSQTASRRFYFVFVCVLQHSSDQYIVLTLYFCYLFLLLVALVFVFAWWIIKKIISDSGLLFYLLSSIPGFFVVLYSLSYFIMCLVIVTKGEGGCVRLRKMCMDSQGVPSDQRAHTLLTHDLLIVLSFGFAISMPSPSKCEI